MSLPAHALPDVWRAHELARSREAGLDTGYPALNAVLPEGGWAVGLTELMQPRPACGEWGLLSPALARLASSDAARGAGRRVPRAAVLVGAPHAPFGPALAARRFDPSHLLHVPVESLADRLWSAEQALRCADVAAVLLWLGQVQAAHLRRLHIAAQEHAKLLFVFRPVRAQHESSPAPLRLSLQWSPPLADAPAPEAAPALLVRVLKRRGPPLEVSLPLATTTPGLQALLAASRAQSRRRRAAFSAPVLERVHAVDRAASLV